MLERTFQRLRACDPRYYQVTILSLLLVYGVCRLDFGVSFGRILLILTAVFASQYVFGRFLAKLPFDPRSALISGLSLCLLLRSNSSLLAAACAIVTIASKFVLRFDGKHVFNPTNFGLAFMLLCAPGQIWVSPAQWGSAAFFGFLVLCAGGLVVNRARRSDVTLAFLFAWLGVLFGRSFWLGEPISIPIHRAQNGALLIFAFFMISDPRTTPDNRAARILFAILVALGAACVQFRFFRTNGLVWSLAACSLAVPLLNRILPGARYSWTGIRKGLGSAQPKFIPKSKAQPLPKPCYETTPA